MASTSESDWSDSQASRDGGRPPASEYRELADSLRKRVSGCLDTPGAGTGSHSADESVTEWPSFRGDRHNTGYAGGVAPTGAEPTTEWTFEADDMIWSSPALADGTVYVADWDGIVHAVDAASGDSVWTADTFGDYISGSVAVDEEAVYIGDTPLNTLDDPTTYYGDVFRFDRETGEER